MSLPSYLILLGVGYFVALVLLVVGSFELYKVNGFLTRQCQVKSIDLKIVGRAFYPRWKIRVTYENETEDGFLISKSSYAPENSAWSKAQKYQINDTYPCYHSSNPTAIITWNWQWSKPSKLKAYLFIFAGVTLIIIVPVLLILIQRYIRRFTNTRRQQDEQQQLEVPLRSKKQRQTIAHLQSLPPPYDKAVRWSVKEDRRI